VIDSEDEPVVGATGSKGSADDGDSLPQAVEVIIGVETCPPTSERRLTFSDFILLLVSLKIAGLGGSHPGLVHLLYSDMQRGVVGKISTYDDLASSGERMGNARALRKLWSQ
jgi:hypothetical protein